MSFVEHKDCPSAGDTVIVYLNFNLFYAVTLKAGETFQTKYGALRHNDMIGKPYGSRVPVKNGYVHFLWPTPELWTLSLPHRTQILYTRDISLTVFNLDLRPGSVVVESGTGSGSMTHSLARAVAPHGKVYTFDFHQQRSEVAQEEFNTHGLGDLVKCAHRDVCADGFGLEGVADAVFLDLPHPWLAVEHAVKALKDTGGRICSFSPCIEQVQRTCEKLRELRCIEITTVECLERPFEVKRVQMAKQSSDSKKGLEYFLGEDGLPFETTPAESEQMETNGASCDGETAVPDGGEPAKKIRRTIANGPKNVPKGDEILTAIPSVKIPGHTGYLTFATFFGRPSETEQSESVQETKQCTVWFGPDCCTTTAVPNSM